MRKSVMSMAMVLVLATGATAGQVPVRPVPLNSRQFAQLQAMQSHPSNASVLTLRASYASEREKMMERTRMVDDSLTIAYDVGLVVGLTLLLICAAPL
jgi:hypothetical protein